MLDLSKDLEEISLEGEEYAHLTADADHQSDSFQVHIPKLMPDIPFSKSNTWIETVNPAIFANESGCAIKASATVKCQNYVTCKRLPRMKRWYFRHGADNSGRLRVGAVFTGTAMNSNYKDFIIKELL